MNNVKAEIGQSLSGRYKLFVIDQQEQVVSELPWQKNLILNQGMDQIPTILYADVMSYGFVGTGTRTNNISSGNSSGSVASSVFTLVTGSTGLQNLTSSNSGHSSALSVGDMIKFNDLSEVRVLAVSGISASITPTSTISVQPFTIYKTSQTGLQSLVHSTNNMFVGNSDGTYCGTTIVGNVQKNKRTWDFVYETASIVFTEVGVGSGTSNANVFSRVLLPQTQSILAGQKLRLMYELDIAVYPTGSSPGYPATASVSGWPVSPSTDTGFFYNLQLGGPTIGWVSVVDDTGGSDGRVCEPAATTMGAFVSTNSQSCANYNSGVNREINGVSYAADTFTQDAYVPLSFTAYKTATFAVANANVNNIRCIGVGSSFNGHQGFYCGFACVFNQPQTKSNIQTLSLTYVWNWGRTLS